jgi:hypothetical protein
MKNQKHMLEMNNTDDRYCSVRVLVAPTEGWAGDGLTIAQGSP